MHEARCLTCFEQFQQQQEISLMPIKHESLNLVNTEDLVTSKRNEMTESIIVGRRRPRHSNAPRQIKPETINEMGDEETEDTLYNNGVSEKLIMSKSSNNSISISEEIENQNGKKSINLIENNFDAKFTSKISFLNKEVLPDNLEEDAQTFSPPVNKRSRLLVQEKEFS